MEPEAGIGPATYTLRVRCSTTELPGADSTTESIKLPENLVVSKWAMSTWRNSLRIDLTHGLVC